MGTRNNIVPIASDVSRKTMRFTEEEIRKLEFFLKSRRRVWRKHLSHIDATLEYDKLILAAVQDGVELSLTLTAFKSW